MSHNLPSVALSNLVGIILLSIPGLDRVTSFSLSKFQSEIFMSSGDVPSSFPPFLFVIR